jgi:hypothetical protein
VKYVNPEAYKTLEAVRFSGQWYIFGDGEKISRTYTSEEEVNAELQRLVTDSFVEVDW